MFCSDVEPNYSGLNRLATRLSSGISSVGRGVALQGMLGRCRTMEYLFGPRLDEFQGSEIDDPSGSVGDGSNLRPKGHLLCRRDSQ